MTARILQIALHIPLGIMACVVLFLSGTGCVARAELPGGGVKRENTQFHSEKGVLLLRKGNLPQAFLEFHEAARLGPGNPDAHNNLGIVLYARGDYAGALSEFLLAVQLAPGMAPARSNLGFALFEQGALGSALKQWQAAVKLDQRLASAWAGLALGLLSFGHPDEAILSYGQALTLDPRYGDMQYLRHVRFWSPAAIRQAETILRLRGAGPQAHSHKLRI